MARHPAFAAAVLAAMMSGIAAGAVGAVYKCAGGEGVPLYTDLPCKGGTLVDIRPGTADPAAVARLEREQDRFAALALAEAQRNDDEVDANGAYRGSNVAGGYRPYEDEWEIASENDVVYVPIFVSARPAFPGVHRHHHRSRRFVPHHGGVTGTSMPAPRGMPVIRSREPQSISQVTAMTWK